MVPKHSWFGLKENGLLIGELSDKLYTSRKGKIWPFESGSRYIYGVHAGTSKHQKTVQKTKG